MCVRPFFVYMYLSRVVGGVGWWGVRGAGGRCGHGGEGGGEVGCRKDM